MHKPKSIKELLGTGGKRLTDLQVKSRARTSTLEHVRAALPPTLAENVVSAGIEQGRLTLGVATASWAARLRYVTETLKMRVNETARADIHSVRIRVVPPRS
jgi:hypothetical protein